MSRVRSLTYLLIVALGCILLSGCSVAGDEQTTAQVAAPPSEGQAQSSGFENDVKVVAAFLEQHPSRLQKAQITRLAPVIVSESRRSGFPLTLVLAVIDVESSGNSFARSSAGALGLMQLRPITAEATAQEIGIEWYGSDMLFDPVDNVRLGVAYLERMVARFGDLPIALAAYNWGPTRVSRVLESGGRVPEAYANRVLQAFEGGV
jgi:soluble lytic murein transglycosylase-like protein